MRVVAILTVRNEELVLGRTIEHLRGQGVDACVIDNDSEDGTRALAESYLGRGVVRVERLPFGGVYDLEDQLLAKEELARELEADWFIHQGADEIREAPAPYATLCEGLAAAEAAGCNAVNFDEFVFVPSGSESFEGRDFVAEMTRYYFFEPWLERLVTAWRNTGVRVDLVGTGGHGVTFPGRRVFPVPFVLRHYITLSREHAVRTYGSRVYAPAGVARGWHGGRARFDAAAVRLPEKEALKELGPVWDRSDPWTHHPIFPV